ncbi:MAG: MOP flippase family protein [Thermoproteota archaeon]|nr:MOP flippase family protein [Thermoproteota archaeon]
MVSLRKQAFKGIKWTTVSSGFTTSLQLVRLTILAHLLTPEDFGIVAMVVVVIGFIQAFSDMGVSNAIIHRQASNKQQLSSLYWLNIFAGVSVFIVLILSRSLIASFFQEPKLTNLIVLASLVFLIMPFGQQFQLLLQKELRFTLLAIVEMVSTFFDLLVAVMSALFGYGVLSLIFGQLFGAAVKAFLLTIIGFKEWRPIFHFSRSDLKGFLRFGAFQMGERSINYLSANFDYLLIGRFLGPEFLGVYSIAYQIVISPLLKINPVLTRVAFPIFAKKQHDNIALQKGYLEMSKLLALICLPILIGIAATAHLIIPLFFGDEWLLAVGLVQILTVVGATKTFGNPIGSILLAKGRADIGFYWNVFVAIINFFSFWFAVSYGVNAVAWTYAFLSIIYFFLIVRILQYVISLPWKQYFAVFIYPAVSSAVMGSLVYVSFFVALKKIDIQIALPILIILGGSVYIFSILILEKHNLLSFWQLLKEKPTGSEG